MTTMSSFEENSDGELVLAYQDIEAEIPRDIVEKYGEWVKVLDLSHNNIKDPKFLSDFKCLTTLILDHNRITSESEFPQLTNLHTLWINNNGITELSHFIARLAQSAPNLHYLSMMKNPAIPCSFGAETYAKYAMYRYFVINYFLKLEHLDDQRVFTAEREEAAKHLSKLQTLMNWLPTTPKFPLARENRIV